MNNIIGRIKNTTIANGGCSINIGNHKSADSGYMVAISGNELKLSLDNFNEKEIQNYILSKDIILNKKDVYLGTWIDNNIVYLDTSICVQDKEEALKIAKSSGELAIYDIEKGESIYL